MYILPGAENKWFLIAIHTGKAREKTHGLFQKNKANCNKNKEHF
jgi:hypothetical protein